MNDQNQRRMAAEMRRAKEAKEQAEKDAKAAILREQRAKLARRQAAEEEKKREEEEQIKRTLERKRRAAEERELTLKAMYVPRSPICVSGGEFVILWQGQDERVERDGAGAIPPGHGRLEHDVL